MATYSKTLLSGSTNGKGIQVTNSSPGTTIHTAVAGTSDLDEIWLYAVNTGGADSKLTVEWGGTTNPNDYIEIAAVTTEAGLVLVAPGILLQNGLIVKAFSGGANTINIFGYVNRITA